jgi:arylsulfatase A-like enzyme
VAVIEIPIPESMRGHDGLLSVIARELPTDAIVRHETRAFEIPDEIPARLEFGYAVGEGGWSAGFPPVHFRVEALTEGEPPVQIFERRIDPADDPRDRRWLDASVGLGGFEGKRVRFRFEAEALADAPGSRYDRSFPVFGNPEVVVAGARPGDRPNILLVSLDTLRAKSIGLYGHVRDTMPALERRVAARGAFVRAAVAPVPYTPPSHMTMLTGLEPCAHGVMNRHGTLAADRVTLAELLRAAGYRTAAFTEDAYVVAGAGFARGFDRYTEFRSEESASPGFAAETLGAAEAWLRGRAHEPFFLFVHTYQVHDPFVPPRGYRTLFEQDVQRGQPPEYDEKLRLYEQEVRYTDDVLAGLLDTLEHEGLSENTIVVITSDHGESFSEHTIAGHGFTLYDDELLVPLVIRAPGLVPEGLVLETQVGLVDLTPTLLDLVGLEIPQMMQGSSFAPQLRGESTSFSEPTRVSRLSGAERWAVRSMEYKYIRMKPKGTQADADWREFLFHLPTDPEERKNLAAVRTDMLEQAREALRSHQNACEAWNRAHPPALTERDRAEDLPGWFLNRDEIEAKLRSLGYVE